MLLPSLYSNLLQLQRCVAKIIAHEKLETEQLSTIRIPVSELKWYEKGRELFYHNQLFDVESFYIQNDTIVIRGLTDTRETEIDLAVNKLVHNSAFDLVLTTIGENIFDFTAFQPTQINVELPLDISQEDLLQRHVQQDLPEIFTSVQTPPPNTLSYEKS